MALIAAFALPLVAAGAAVGQSVASQGASTATPETERASVIVDGRTLFQVRGLSSYPAEKRANQIAARIREVAAMAGFNPDSLQVASEDEATVIRGGNTIIIRIFEADAAIESIDRHVLAQAYVIRIREAVLAYRRERTPSAIAHDVLYVAGATLAFLVVLWLIRRAKQAAENVMDRRLRARLEKIESKSYQIVRTRQVWGALQGGSRLLWLAVSLFVGFWYLNFVLGILPWTRRFGGRLLDLIVEPLRNMGQSILESIPDLVFLVILVVVVRYLLKALRIFVSGVAEGAIKLRDFDAEWAWPTYRLVRLFIIVLTVVVAFPYIPGSDSEAFKGVSILLGLVFSLGSSSVISNIVAGYSMVYRRAFRIGDRIQIGEITGYVTEARLLVTHLRTLKNEEIVVPNSLLLTSSVVNYSTLARQGLLLLHTTVGIGYETPWRQVEAMLLLAAAKTVGAGTARPPFVLQKELGDFCVTYEVNVSCDDARVMEAVYTSLRQCILDVFNEYGVQIMTPAYKADPAEAKTVPRELWYSAPAREADESSPA